MPTSRHCEQYGRRRSHVVFRFVQAKQSSEAPLAGALLRRFLGAEASTATGGGHVSGTVMFAGETPREYDVETCMFACGVHE